MAPAFNFDPTTVVATQEVLPKGEYEFQIGEPKSFIRKNRKGEDSYGVRYPLTVKAPDEYNGKKAWFSTYYQSEGSQSMAKIFIMTVLGYGLARNASQDAHKQEEARFNSDYRGKDWSFDPETGSVGDIYRELTGKRVIGSVDVGKNDETGDPMQQFKSWRPISSGALNNG